MLNPFQSRRLRARLLALPFALAMPLALLSGSCGGTSSEADPYQGLVFATDGILNAFDTKFLGSTDSTICPEGTPCYPLQLGFANGKPVLFYNLISAFKYNTSPPPPQVPPQVSSSTPGGDPIPVSVVNKQSGGSGGARADTFDSSSCNPAPYDRVTDPYPRDAQAPIFDGLPLVAQSPCRDYLSISTQTGCSFVWPIVARYSVVSASGGTCNDLKDSRSIPDRSTGAVGPYGAQRLGSAPVDYRLWAPIDLNATVMTKTFVRFGEPQPSMTSTPAFAPKLAWYRGLQLRYLDGGVVPVDTASGTFRTMDGLLLTYPAVSTYDPPETNIAKVMGNGNILLAAGPTEPDRFSPIVQLQTASLPSGKNPGDYKGFCPPTQATACDPTYADLKDPKFKLSKTTYRIFIVAQPPN